MCEQYPATRNGRSAKPLFASCDKCSRAVHINDLVNALCNACTAAYQDKLRATRERESRSKAIAKATSMYNTRVVDDMENEDSTSTAVPHDVVPSSGQDSPAGNAHVVSVGTGTDNTRVPTGDECTVPCTQVEPTIPVNSGNTVTTGTVCIPDIDRQGEKGTRPLSPQARQIPALYVPGTRRRYGFDTGLRAGGTGTMVPTVQGAFKTIQPGLGAHNGLKIWYNGVVQNLGNQQVGTEELRANIEAAFLMEEPYNREPYVLRALDNTKSLYTTDQMPLPMRKILELVLVKDLSPEVWKAYAASKRAEGDAPNGISIPSGRNTPDNSTAEMPHGRARSRCELGADGPQCAGGTKSSTAAGVPAPMGPHSGQLYPDTDDERLERESPESTPTSKGVTRRTENAGALSSTRAAPCAHAPAGSIYVHARGACTPTPGRIHHITCETVDGATEYRYHEIQLQGDVPPEMAGAYRHAEPTHPLLECTGRPGGQSALHNYPAVTAQIEEEMASVPKGFIDKIVSARRNLMATTGARLEYLCRLAGTGSNVSEGYTWLSGSALQNFGHVLAEFVQRTEERKEEDTIAQGFAEAEAVPLRELTGQTIPERGDPEAAGRESEEPQILLTALEPSRLGAARASGSRRSAGSPRLRRQPTVRNIEGLPPWARSQDDTQAAAPSPTDAGASIRTTVPRDAPRVRAATARDMHGRGSNELPPELPIRLGSSLARPPNKVSENTGPILTRENLGNSVPDTRYTSDVRNPSGVPNPENSTGPVLIPGDPGMTGPVLNQGGEVNPDIGTDVHENVRRASPNVPGTLLTSSSKDTSGGTQVPTSTSANTQDAPNTESTRPTRTRRRTAAGAPAGQPGQGDDSSSGDDNPRRPEGHGRAASPPPMRRRQRESSDDEGRERTRAGSTGSDSRGRPRSRSPTSSDHRHSRDRSRSHSDSRSLSRAESEDTDDRLDAANERLRKLANLTTSQYVRCVMRNPEGSEYLDLALRNAQAARDLERGTVPHPTPRPPVVRLPRELEWPKIDDKLKYRHSDKRTPVEFRRALEMLTNHVARPLRTSHLLTKAVELKVNEAILGEFLSPHRDGTVYAQAADIDYDEIFDWLTLRYGPIDRKSTCTRAYLDLQQLSHEDAKAYISRRLLKKAELDRLGILAVLPDLERQLLLSSIDPSLAVWVKTTFPDFETTDPATLAKHMITRDQAVRSAQKSHKPTSGGRPNYPQRNLNAMVKRNPSGKFKRKATMAYSQAKPKNPKAHNLFAMWNDGQEGASPKAYSQSKHSSRSPNGTQLPSLRDMKPNYSQATWDKRVDNQGKLRPNIDATDPKQRALHCNDCWPAGSKTPWCLICKRAGHNLTGCLKLSQRSKPSRRDGKGKGKGRGNQGMKGRSKNW